MLGTEASPIPSSRGRHVPRPLHPCFACCGVEAVRAQAPSPTLFGASVHPLATALTLCGPRSPFLVWAALGTVLGAGILCHIRRQPFGFSPGTKCFNHMVRDTVKLCPFIGLKTYSPSTILQYLDWVRSASLGCSKFVAGSSLRELKEAVLPQSAGLTWVIPKSPQPQQSWGRSLRGERCFILTVFVLNGLYGV